MTYKQYINKWKINKTMLAKEIGMPIGTFSSRFSKNPKYKFSEKDLHKIKKTIQEMGRGLKDVEFKD